jgi:hypothetical protein
MAELPCMQELEGSKAIKPSAHLAWTRFQRFTSSQITTPHVMIFKFAQQNLENQIRQSFQTPAIPITQNPY